jgi:hypothetical protein
VTHNHDAAGVWIVVNGCYRYSGVQWKDCRNISGIEVVSHRLTRDPIAWGNHHMQDPYLNLNLCLLNTNHCKGNLTINANIARCLQGKTKVNYV